MQTNVVHFPILFLKATAKKQVWIPQFSKKNGQVVGGHYSMVHVSDDHDHHKVAGGQGTYSQKKAHAQLHAEEGDAFHALPAEDKAALVMHHATQIQDSESQAARIATLRKKLLAGEKPTPGEWKAFHAAAPEKQHAVTEAVHAAGHGAHMDSLYAGYVSTLPPANEKPAEPAQPAPPVKQEPDKAAEPAPAPEPKAEAEKPASAAPEAPAAPAGSLSIPEFAEGKTTTGVKAYYEKVASTIIAMAAAGDVAGLESMPQPEKGSWGGKTANSKTLLALHAAALAQATGEKPAAPVAAPAAAEPSDRAGKFAEAKADPHKALAGQLGAAGFPAMVGSKGVLLASSPDYPKTYANNTQAMNAAVKLTNAGFDAEVIGHHPFYVKVHGKMADLPAATTAPAAEAGPKEGDTKEGEAGTLVLKDGHWVLQAQGSQAYAYLKQSIDTTATVMEAAKEWQAANPEYDAVLAHTLEEMGFAGYADKLGLYAAPAEPEPAPFKVDMPAKPEVTGWKIYNDDVEAALQTGNQAELQSLIDMITVNGEEPHQDGNAGKVLAYAKQSLAYVQQHSAQVAAATVEPDDAKATQQLVDAFHDAKVPLSNTNAKAFNPKVDAIIAALQAGDKDALLGMSFGTNTYGKKAAKLANEALTFLGTRHQVAPGQKAGAHPKLKVLGVKIKDPAAAAPEPAAAAPAPAAAPATGPTPPPLEGLSPSKVEVLASVIANFDKKDIANLEIQVASMEGLAGFASIHKYATEAITHLQAGAEQEALAAGWTAAISSGVAPSKQQAEAMEALKQSNPDAYEDIASEAQVGYATGPGGIDTPDDYMAEVSANKVKELHAQALAGGQAAPVGLSDAEIGSWETNPNYWKAGAQKAVELAKQGDLAGLEAHVSDLVAQDWPNTAAFAAALATKLEKKQGAVPAAPAIEDGPKEGDTKQGADGMLVFENGRWHKMGDDPKVLKQKADSVPVPKLKGTNSIKMNKAIKALHHIAITQGAAGIDKAVTPSGPGGSYTAIDASGHKWKISNDPDVSSQNGAKLVAYAKALQAAMAGTAGSGAPQDVPAAAPKATPAAGGAPTVGVTKTEKVGKISAMIADGWEQTGPQKGSNPGGKYKDGKGQEWYCKFPSDPDTVKNELLAAKFYQMLGSPVPELRLVKKDGKLGIASKWVDGMTQGTPADLAGAEGAHAGFVFDAWLANWDVVGLSNDNLLLGKDGKALRVDVGGSLLFRAQGGAKGDAFGDTVPELDTLLDPAKNGKSAAVFGGMKPEDMMAGAAVLAKMHPSQIDKLCRTFGPGTRAEQEALAQKLVKRRDFILKKLGVTDPWSAAPPDITKLPVDVADLPPAIDFNNYQGTGKGLSSKAHINQQNTIDDAALISFAKDGNLKALQEYHYDAFDKETGAYIGKKPIGQHPNKDIKNHWASMCDLLTAIAHPPVEGLDLPPIGGGSIEEVSEAAGYVKPGENIKTISGDKVVGFWMKLGHVGADAVKDLMPPKTSYLKSDFVTAAKKWYKGASSATKALVNAIQDSGHYNRFWNNGDKTISVSSHGHSYNGGAQSLANTIYSEAVEMEEGQTVGRWMNLPDTMKQQLLKEGAGLVLQNADSMCTSIFKDWGDNAKFGSGAYLNIRFAKGAKAMASLGSGRFAGSGQDAEGNYIHKGNGGEMEVTTLMGQRFVVLAVKQGNASSPNGITLDLLALPPHEGYLAELGDMAQMGKAIFHHATTAMRKAVVVFVKHFAKK